MQQIEAPVRRTPDLSFNLLQLVNSAATGTHKHVTSLSEAITVLGRKQLQRWLQLLVFTLSSAPHAEFPSPLLILAATRGKLMELIARALAPADRDSHDRAFMTGILSLVHARLACRCRRSSARCRSTRRSSTPCSTVPARWVTCCFW